MIGFFERYERSLLVAGELHHAKARRRRPQLTRRAGLALAAILIVPAAALAGASVLWAPDPPPPEPPVETPRDFERVGPVTRPAYIAEGVSPTGVHWRISAYACGDQRPDHVVLGLHTTDRDPARPCQQRRRNDPVHELHPRETYQGGLGATISYGTTSARVDTVELLVSGSELRVPTRAVSPSIAGPARLPEGFRFWAVELPGDEPVSPKRIVALSRGETVACLESSGVCGE
ncbi:MAG TPA: hypothetical protein VF520_16800 [Thermoleophilaceae bacterium]|jgi:hypothetical protein